MTDQKSAARDGALAALGVATSSTPAPSVALNPAVVAPSASAAVDDIHFLDGDAVRDGAATAPLASAAFVAPTAAPTVAPLTTAAVLNAAAPRAEEPQEPVPPATPSIAKVVDDVGSGEYQGQMQNDGYTDDQTPTLSGSGGNPGNLIKIYDKGTLIGSVLVKANGTWSFSPTSKLLEGEHSYTVTATDRQTGAESTHSAPFNFTIDLTAPTAVAAVEGVGDAEEGKPFTTTDKSPLLFGSLDHALAANEKLQMSVDGGDTWHDIGVVNGTDWQYQDARNLDNGSYTYLMRAIDAAGNQGAISSQKIAVDAPATPEPGEHIKVAITGITPDTGVQGDYVTSASKITLMGTLSEPLPAGGQLQISTDGGKTWFGVPSFGTSWTYADPAVHNLGTETQYLLHVVNAAGQEIAGSQALQTVEFDAGLPIPEVTSTFDLSTDTAIGIVGEYSTAASATNRDYITRDDTLTLSGKLSRMLNIGEQLQLSLDGGKTWQTVLANGGALWSYTSDPLASQTLGVKLQLVNADGGSLALGERQVVVDLDSPVPFAFAPQLDAHSVAGERTYYSSTQYGLAEGGATVALVDDVNRDGRYQEGLDKIVGYAVAGNDGRWSFDASLKEGVHQLGFVTWDVAGNNSGFSNQVVTTAGQASNGVGATLGETNWGGTLASVRGVDAAAMTLNQNGSWSFFESTGYALSSTAWKNAGMVYSGNAQGNYTANYLAEPGKVSADGNGHMISKATFADYNRDGLMDVLGNVTGNSDYMPLWTAQADGSYTAGVVNNPKKLNIGAVIAWDGNGDGYTDFIQIDNTQGFGFNLISNNAGSLNATYQNKTWWAAEVSGVDLDNNGTVDLAGHNDKYGNTNLSVLLTGQDGSFGNELNLGSVFRSDTANKLEYGNLPTSMTWADFNGDGYLDLFLPQGRSGSTGYSGDSDDSRIYLNKGADASGKWLGLDVANPLFFNDVMGLQKNGNPYHFDGGPSFAVDWNHDGKMDVIEVPRQNAQWSNTNGDMAPVLYLNNGTNNWLNSGKTMTDQRFGNITGAMAVDYDWDGAKDLLMYRTSGSEHLGQQSATAPALLVHNDNAVAYGSSLILHLLDKNGLNTYFGNTVQLFDSQGHLVSSQIINPQSGVSNDSSGLVYFYDLDPNEVYSAKLLTNSTQVGADAALKNPTWDGLTTGDAYQSIVLNAGDPEVSYDSPNVAGTGYNDLFTATEGNDVINGGGGWNVLANGSKVWSATQGMDVVDYGLAKMGLQINLQSGVSQGMGNDTLKNIEGIKAGQFADAIVDNGANNQIEGRGGDDVMYLFGGGNDTLVYRSQGGYGDISADGGNGHDIVFGFSLGNPLNNGNADILDLRGLFAYNGPVSLNQNDGVLQLDTSSRGLLDYLQTRVEGGNTVVSIDRDGAGNQVGMTDLVTLAGVKSDLLTLLQNHQIMV